MTKRVFERFTKQFIESLIPPTKGRVYYHDDKEGRLALYVTATGSVTFYTRKRVNGRDVRMVIGNFPDVTIEQARKKSQELRGLVASGKDPHREQQRIKFQNQTFEELFEEYMTRYSKVHKKSWKYDEREVNRFLSHWFKRRLNDIPKLDVQKLHERIYIANGLHQANRILERLRAMYNKAIEWGWEGINPTEGIKKYKEQSRDRFIQPSEMPYLLRSLDEEENITVRDLFWMLLLTGARKTNTLMMQFEEVDKDGNGWRIPDTKNGEPQLVALVSRAMEIINRRRKGSNSHWVFPQDGDAEKHFADPKRAWKRILSRATLYLWRDDENVGTWIMKIEKGDLPMDPTNKLKAISKLATKAKMKLPTGLMDIRIHDIRRTFGSYQALAGASLQVIGKSLGHKSQQSTQIYARLNLDPIRNSILKATDIMFHK